MAEKKMVLELAGREVAISNPGKCSSRAPGTPSWTWCATTWPWRRARCRRGRPAMALKRFVNGPTTTRSSRSGRRRNGRTGCRRRTPLPLRPHRRRGGGATRPRWPGGQLAASTEPASGARRRPGPPGRAQVDLDPVPGGMAADQGRGHGGRRRAGDFGLTAGRRRPVPRHPRLRPDRAAVVVRRGPPRGGAVAREIERRAPELALQVVKEGGTASSSTITRTPRTARSRPLTRSGRCRTPGSPPADLAEVRRAIRPRTPSTPCLRVSRPAAIRGGHGRGGRVAGRAARAGGVG